MTKYITVKLTEDQARELPFIIRRYLELDENEVEEAYSKVSDIDEQHYAFVRRIESTINKQLAKAKS